MSNTEKLREAQRLLNQILSDLEEKLDLIQAEETHGDGTADREDDWSSCKLNLEEVLELLDKVENDL